jgi:hypothetical protein
VVEGAGVTRRDRSLTYLLGNPPEVAPQHSEQPRWLGYVTEIVTELYKFRPVAYCPIQEDEYWHIEPGKKTTDLCIGYRHIGPDVSFGQVITQEQALRLLVTDLQALASKLSDLLPAFDTWYPQIQAVVVSLVFDQGFNGFRYSRLGREMTTNWYGYYQPMECYEECYEKYFRNRDRSGRDYSLYCAHLGLIDEWRLLVHNQAKAKAEAKRGARRAAMRAKRIEASRCHRAGLATWRASKQTEAAA